MVAFVPAFNEEKTVGETVAALLSVAGIDEVRVIDDGSTDGTAQAAAAAGARVVKLKKNLGKGGALNAALSDEKPADIVLLIDSDVGETAAEAARLLAPVKDGEADMAIAVPPKRPGTGGFGLALGLARRVIKHRTGFEAKAPLSGQRALNAKAILAVRPLVGGFGLETAMTIDALAAGLKVVEVPANFTHDYTYRNIKGFLHRGRQFLAIVRVALRRQR
ncbi:MAG: glycosyltransferase family 2 protein [Actinomycetota bacterium]